MKAGIIQQEENTYLEPLERKQGSSPEDDLEVMRPEHFILPACILLGGLTAASITFLCEILYSRKYRGKNTTDIENHEEQDNTKGNTITLVKPSKREIVVKRKVTL